MVNLGNEWDKVLEGEFDSLIYPDSSVEKGKKSFFSKLLGGE